MGLRTRLYVFLTSYRTLENQERKTLQVKANRVLTLLNREVSNCCRFQTGYITLAILQPEPIQFAAHSVSTSPHILSPASRRRSKTLASTSPTPAIKRRSVLRSFPSGLLLVMMPQTSLIIAIWQRAARLLMSDKAAAAGLGSGWSATASDMLDVNALACDGGISFFTLSKPDSCQVVAVIAATNNAAPEPAHTKFMCAFKPKISS